MSLVAPPAQAATFVLAPGGARFRLLSEPARGSIRGTIVLAHAFADEMNKSRRMCARLARGLASRGWRVVQRDLYGCGDSAGEFRDATWSTWVDDVRAEMRNADAGLPVWLWCMRAGALLAPAALAQRPDAHLLLWQPVVTGAQHLQQFLRLHLGARIVGGAKGAAEASPIQRLRSGQTVELGGYGLGPALAAGLEQAVFDVPEEFTGRVVWFEIAPDENPAPTPMASQLAQRLRERGIDVALNAVQGPAFWQTQEIEDSEALLALSLAAVDQESAGALPATAEGVRHA